MYCLTDGDWKTSLPITFIDVSNYELDTWWNKVAMFDSAISKDGVNLYFDLDVKIIGNIDFMVNDVEGDTVCVVDTLWKDGNFLELASQQKFADAFYCYGNTSVMGWRDQSQEYLFQCLMDDPFITVRNFGDDTFINKTARVKYFSPFICDIHSSRYMKSMSDKRILIHVKDPP